MKRFSILIIAMLAAQAQSQTTRGPLRTRTSQQLTQDSRDAADKLGAARANGTVEEGRLSAANADEAVVAGKVKKAADDLLRSPDPAETNAAQRGEASMAAALKNVSAEGKKLLAQGAARGPTTAPPGSGEKGIEAAPKPQPLTPTPIENPAVPGDRITITCTGAAFFDSETSIMLFTENVEVRHPQFFVLCDEFEIHMIKDAKPKDGAAPEKKALDPINNPLREQGKSAAPVAGGASGGNAGAGQPVSDSSIKFAIARGRMVTIEKYTETGDIQVGHAKHATYEGATGNILLRDFPQVQRGQHLQIATDPATTMTLKQNGALDTKGPSRTEIIQEKAKGDTHLNKPTAAPAASPNPNASPRQPTQ